MRNLAVSVVDKPLLAAATDNHRLNLLILDELQRQTELLTSIAASLKLLAAPEATSVKFTETALPVPNMIKGVR
jgi:hypothetical protein